MWAARANRTVRDQPDRRINLADIVEVDFLLFWKSDTDQGSKFRPDGVTGGVPLLREFQKSNLANKVLGK
jgi:hypothetical protein